MKETSVWGVVWWDKFHRGGWLGAADSPAPGVETDSAAPALLLISARAVALLPAVLLEGCAYLFDLSCHQGRQLPERKAW